MLALSLGSPNNTTPDAKFDWLIRSMQRVAEASNSEVLATDLDLHGFSLIDTTHTGSPKITFGDSKQLFSIGGVTEFSVGAGVIVGAGTTFPGAGNAALPSGGTLSWNLGGTKLTDDGDGFLFLDTGSVSGGGLEIRNSSNQGAAIYFEGYNPSVTNGDLVGFMQFFGNNSALAHKNYFELDVTIFDKTAGTETAGATFYIKSAGSLLSIFELGGSAITGIEGFADTVNLNLGNADSTALFIRSTAASAGGPSIAAYHNSASPAVNDQVFGLWAYGNDSTAAIVEYGAIIFYLLNPTHGSLNSYISFHVRTPTGVEEAFFIENGEIDITGTGVATAFVLRSNGAFHVGDSVGEIDWQGKNASGTGKYYGQMQCLVVDPTAASEDGEFYWNLTNGGTSLQNRMHLSSLGELDLYQDNSSPYAIRFFNAAYGGFCGMWQNNNGEVHIDVDAAETFYIAPAHGGFGYFGGGGTITQITSKTTGVTLSKQCGRITMNNAALAAAAEATFTVTNTIIAATDVVIVNHGSGGTSGAYAVVVSAIAAGSFNITVSNLSAGSLSEAIVINYAVIKAA